MSTLLDRRLTWLAGANAHALFEGRRLGLERETLRVAPDGQISQIRHPLALGAALTHPFITTDYSEALLEFITPPLANAEEALRFLDECHRLAYEHIGDELLWAASMPVSYTHLDVYKRQVVPSA